MSLTPLDKKAIWRSFDRAASGYDRHAVLQREVESRLLERIEFQRLEPGLILDMGCGTGSASRLLAGHNKQAKVIALDWAPAMLKQAVADTGQGSGDLIHPLCADMHTLPFANRSIDLIFSNLALQWSYDLPAIFREFRRVMNTDAMLVFSSFGPDTLTELKQAWRSVDGHPHVNDFPDMHDIGDELLAVGFREPVMDAERLTLDYPDVTALMRELKGLGESNVASDRMRGLTGKKRMQSVLDAYQQFRRNDRFPASYEVIYGAAFAPAEGQPMKTPEGDVATFSIDHIITRKGSGR
ncbi:MAG: malonyl-ACP O-methyltransferase BioC [Xanthomonadales bacterium]|nr:malonyl-ACP O-methyltransferase BioC [Xanthomonadales bacterium]